jgi:hypothetical protein
VVSFVVALAGLELVSFVVLSAMAMFGGKFNDPKNRPNWTEETVEFNRELQSFGHYLYEPFIGWRSEPKSGVALNIDENGNRVTANINNDNSSSVYDFYGGSTTWGFGVADASTVPSLFARLSNSVFARNFGEQAYNSRQELNYFLNNVTLGKIGNVVIFYDGENDAFNSCFASSDPFGDARGGVIRSVMMRVADDGRIRNLSEDFTIKNAVGLILPNTGYLISLLTGKPMAGVSLNLPKIGGTDICRDPFFADLVAENVVTNWKAAKLIADAHGAAFFAILQPLPYTSDVRQPYNAPMIDETVKAVYPLIKAKAGNFGWFVDGTAWLNGRSDLYTDEFGHVTKAGNQIVAEQIFRRVYSAEKPH